MERSPCGAALAATAICGFAVGMGCACPDYADAQIVANTNHADLAGAHVYLYADRVEITYARWNDTGWTAVFGVESLDTSVPVDTADTADTAR